MKVLIVNGSVREQQGSVNVATWVEKTARQSMADTEVETLQLKELDLPMFNEAVVPMMNKDRKSEGTVKQWLDAVQSADAFVFVTPEYNHGMPSGLKNAIDYINYQIMHKPFLVVSHGANGGARAGEQLKQVLNANIGGIPLPGSIAINGMVKYHDLISEEGEIIDEATKGNQKSLEGKLQELAWFAGALKNTEM